MYKLEIYNNNRPLIESNFYLNYPSMIYRKNKYSLDSCSSSCNYDLCCVDDK